MLCRAATLCSDIPRLSAVASLAVAAEIGRAHFSSCASLHELNPTAQNLWIKPAPATTRPGAVFRVVLTGGPCGGKSSSLDHLTKVMTAKGFDVLAVPEVPTIMMNGGCQYPGLADPHKLLHFETALMKLQIGMEDSFCSVAESTGRPTLVVLDRGVLDPKAYMDDDTWTSVLSHNGWSDQSLLSRYDMVLHLVSAADGAEAFYTTANNVTRVETPEQARTLDRSMIRVWGRHPRHVIVRNTGGFDEKLAEATEAVKVLVDELSSESTVSGRHAGSRL